MRVIYNPSGKVQQFVARCRSVSPKISKNVLHNIARLFIASFGDNFSDIQDFFDFVANKRATTNAMMWKL